MIDWKKKNARVAPFASGSKRFEGKDLEQALQERISVGDMISYDHYY